MSLLARRQPPESLGFHRLAGPARAVVQILALVVAWALLQLGLFRPVIEHLAGEVQDVNQFEQVHGNLTALLVLVALSWTVAALGEETAYRGLLLTRIGQLIGGGRWGTLVAVLGSSALFGLAHTEQGVVGVGLTFLDGLFLCGLRFRYGTLWAPILAHGFNNTIGLTAYFLLGPVQAFW